MQASHREWQKCLARIRKLTDDLNVDPAFGTEEVKADLRRAKEATLKELETVSKPLQALPEHLVEDDDAPLEESESEDGEGDETGNEEGDNAQDQEETTGVDNDEAVAAMVKTTGLSVLEMCRQWLKYDNRTKPSRHTAGGIRFNTPRTPTFARPSNRQYLLALEEEKIQKAQEAKAKEEAAEAKRLAKQVKKKDAAERKRQAEEATLKAAALEEQKRAKEAKKGSGKGKNPNTAKTPNKDKTGDKTSGKSGSHKSIPRKN